jgi:hypothetical protein
MRISAPIAAALVAALAGAGCGGDDEQSATTEPAADVSPITVQIHSENDSGRSGEVRLEPDGDDAMRVVVTMDVGDTKTNPAHIHDVTCDRYRAMDDFSDQLGTVEDTLTTLQAGKSETKVSVPLADRATGTHSINVHEPSAPFPVVACGDIPKP